MNEQNPDTLSSASTSDRQLSHEEISRRAQELWENYGRPSGRDEEIWLEAERALQNSSGVENEIGADRTRRNSGNAPGSEPSNLTGSSRPSTATATPKTTSVRARGTGTPATR